MSLQAALAAAHLASASQSLVDPPALSSLVWTSHAVARAADLAESTVEAAVEASGRVIVSFSHQQSM